MVSKFSTVARRGPGRQAERSRRASLIRSAGAAVILFAVGVLPGCGRGVGDVSGTVYLKDKVVTSGTVTMIAADGVPRQTEIAENGAYRIERVPAGEVKVVVVSPPIGAKKPLRPPVKRGEPDTKFDERPE